LDTANVCAGADPPSVTVNDRLAGDTCNTGVDGASDVVTVTLRTVATGGVPPDSLAPTMIPTRGETNVRVTEPTCTHDAPSSTEYDPTIAEPDRTNRNRNDVADVTDEPDTVEPPDSDTNATD